MSTATSRQTSLNRRRFNDDLKLQVVRLVRDQKIPVVQVCRDFNISSSSLHRWLNQYDAERDGRAGAAAHPRAGTREPVIASRRGDLKKRKQKSAANSAKL